MEETADKGLEVKGSDAAIRKSRVIGRIFVTGYDITLPRKFVIRVLKKLYSSCGKITDVYLPMSNSNTKSIWRVAIIYFVGEGAVDKALRLNGTDMGGWTLCAEDYPFLPYAGCFAGFAVEGYDNSLSVSDIKCQFGKLFSSCGKIVEANIYKSSCTSMVFVEGEDIEETAPKLSGTEIGGHKVVVRLVTRPKKSTFHPRRRKGRMGRDAVLDLCPDKKAKMTLE